jgi:outer membrane protein TolC
MNKIIGFLIFAGFAVPAEAQRMLNLDSCRALAIRNNKVLNISKLNQDVAGNIRRVAKTQYLPHVDGMGSYTYMSREVSLLSDDQKSALGSMGSTIVSEASSKVTPIITQMVQAGMISQQMAGTIGQNIGTMGESMATALNGIGDKIIDDFHTNTHNLWTASIMVTQPLYMGGRITAANNIARYNENLTANQYDATMQATLFNIDQAYWTVVSLKHKKALAESYLTTVKKLDSDVSKMITEGVATRSDGLSVSVRVNEAEMTLTQVDDGLALSKMYLCQLCGLPINESIVLADEDKQNLVTDNASVTPDVQMALNSRPELKMLGNTVDISKENVKMVRADYMPNLAATGGYMVSNPNVFNGFQNKFAGVWTVGVLLRVPIWNWNEGVYKVHAAKAASHIAEMQLSDAREKIELQVNQGAFKVNEAGKRLTMANQNTAKADENLRCATLGFKEGVLPTTNVLEAQTAWFQAQSQRIDAEIEVKLAEVNMKKALGVLQ